MQTTRSSHHEEVKKLLMEWAVLDRLWREMKDSDVREAIEERRERIRGQIGALIEERRAA